MAATPSMAQRYSMPGELAYGATKGAIEAFTRSLAAELAPLGITVNAVDPGATDTGWITDSMRREWAVPSGVPKINQPDERHMKPLFISATVFLGFAASFASVGTQSTMVPWRTAHYESVLGTSMEIKLMAASQSPASRVWVRGKGHEIASART